MMVTIFVHDPDFMREARKKARRIDYLGIIYLALGLGLLQIVLDRGQRADWFAANWVWLFTVRGDPDADFAGDPRTAFSRTDS